MHRYVLPGIAICTGVAAIGCTEVSPPLSPPQLDNDTNPVALGDCNVEVLLTQALAGTQLVPAADTVLAGSAYAARAVTVTSVP